MVIKRKQLIIAAAIDVALFLIAAPLGGSHHVGEHNHAVTDLGNVVFGAFLIGVVVLIVLIVVALIQYALRSRRTAGNSASQ